MNIQQGQCELNLVLDLLKDKINKEMDSYKISNISGKVKPLYYEMLLTKTLVFYTEKNTIKRSGKDVDFNEIYSDIYYIDDIETLIVLNGITASRRSQYKVSWILLELYTENNKDFEGYMERYILNLLPHFKLLNILDAFKKNLSTVEQKLTYRIDFERLETQFKKVLSFELKELVHNGKEYFYNSILARQLNEKKINDIPVIVQKLDSVEYKNIIINKSTHKNIYKYRCQICNNLHEVILSKSQRDKNTSTPKYKRVSDEFIVLNNNNRYEIVCDHIGTKFEDNGIYFSFEKETLETENINLDKVFLYQFFNFINDDNSIKFYKNNSIKLFSIDSFIKKFGK